MTKVVINACFGGFGLSDAAIRRYAALKGLTLYPETGQFGLTTYWTVPKTARRKSLEGDAWYRAPIEERQAYNEWYGTAVLYDHDLARDDPALIQVVEEMGDAANGPHAKLRVVEIPDGVSWEVEEYDGNEHIAETHRTWG